MEFVKLVGPFGVFFIMFALGLNLSIKRFLRVFSRPKNFIVGILCQILVLPIIGLIVISYFQLDKEFQIGVFLLLIMPSAAMSNYATRIADGNVPLSICLTSICALFSFITEHIRKRRLVSQVLKCVNLKSFKNKILRSLHGA